MNIITKVRDMQNFSIQMKREGKKIGFVPTMGYLHDGHLSLVKKANENCDIVVVSIFVNPTQFGPTEDFTKYPRDEARDLELLKSLNVDAVFMPDSNKIYQSNYQTYVEVEEITKKQEGEFRPTHFRGVTTVVSILFNSVLPDVAVFGQKDAQQAAVIKRMVNDLKFPIRIIIAPIIREPDGLAMSSRNVYLNEQERKDALILHKALLYGEKLIEGKEFNTQVVIDKMNYMMNEVKSSQLDYIRIVDADNFEELNFIEEGKEYYILIACKIGKTRLIDNILISVS